MTRGPVSCELVTPSNLSAASYLSLAGTSKMICEAASTVSHAFCAISLSAVPRPNPNIRA